MRKITQTNQATIHDIRQERTSGSLSIQALERRLDDGYARIEQAKARGEDITIWEDFWIDLLHQYEAAHNVMPEAA